MSNVVWEGIESMSPKKYVCGYCGNDISSEKGYILRNRNTGAITETIYICHHCYSPTYFDMRNKQWPGYKIGETIKNIGDENINKLYNEIRDAFSVSAFTAVILSCRKLLMHIAVSKGADPGKNFLEYIEYLSSKNYIPPDSKEWVDQIRKKGNEANHEIVIMDEEEAKELISFTEMLLKIIFDFPSRIKKTGP